MDRPFRRAVERAGLTPAKVTPHVLRHTAITNLVQAGIDLPTIQKISKHEMLAIVTRCADVHASHIDRAVKVIGRGLPDLAGAENPGMITPELHILADRKGKRTSSA